MKERKKIALLGGNGQISKSIIEDLKKNFLIDVYSRKRMIVKSDLVQCYNFKNFPKNKNIVAIINCAGPGDPENHKINKNIFKNFNNIDNKVINLIKQNRSIKYINISTAAVVNIKFSNKIEKARNNYLRAKLHIENKHRKMKKFKIYDLRVIGFFSRHLNIDYGFFLSKVFYSIKNNKKIKVDSYNNIRDYIGGFDLANFIIKLINSNFSNKSFNLMSKKTTTKFEILNYFKRNYNLNYEVDQKLNSAKNNSLKITKTIFTSSNFFRPKYSSFNLIKKEAKKMLQ